jgi:hypothetical protein
MNLESDAIVTDLERYRTLMLFRMNTDETLILRNAEFTLFYESLFFAYLLGSLFIIGNDAN